MFIEEKKMDSISRHSKCSWCEIEEEIKLTLREKDKSWNFCSDDCLKMFIDSMDFFLRDVRS